MLARLSIRTKMTVVVAFLLVAMSVMGAMNIRQMYAINAATVDITSSWLPSGSPTPTEPARLTNR